jgi:hypothetical protein
MMTAPAAYGFGSSKRVDEVRHDRDHKATGPGAYEVHLKHKKSEPSFSMGAKFKEKRRNHPGSTHILPSKMIESPGKSFGGKLNYEEKRTQGTIGTGPGGYDHEKTIKIKNKNL